MKRVRTDVASKGSKKRRQRISEYFRVLERLRRRKLALDGFAESMATVLKEKDSKSS